MAHISGDAELRDLFYTQGDVYILLASRIFEKHQSDISKQEREQAKVICLGL
jgi:DNA polymerase I-like protein with 3'-5' exonuclease and polymerase domains